MEKGLTWKKDYMNAYYSKTPGLLQQAAATGIDCQLLFALASCPACSVGLAAGQQRGSLSLWLVALPLAQQC